MRLAALAAAALLAAGCAELPVVTDNLDAAARVDRLRAIDDWRMAGRLSVDTGERAFQARFRWHRTPDRMTLTVRGLFGAGSFEIDGNADELTVLSRGETRVLTDPEVELSAMFGWWLPVTSLESWLLGLPDTRYPASVDTGPGGTASRIGQRLWRVDYTDFQLGDGVLVPKRLSLTHDPLRLELSIDAWEPATEPPAVAALN